MIVSEVMATKLVTVSPDDTLSHAANLLRQYQFHHLPVVRESRAVETPELKHPSRKILLLAGMLTSQDIELAASSGRWSSSDVLRQPWQERRVVEVMHRAAMRVSPNTSLSLLSVYGTVGIVGFPYTISTREMCTTLHTVC